MWIEIDQSAQKEGLSGARRPGERDAFSGTDTEIDGTPVLESE
jgi:hypothetical protein